MSVFMMKKNFLFMGIGLAVMSFFAGCNCSNESSIPANKPNIIFIFADDMGWKGLSC